MRRKKERSKQGQTNKQSMYTTSIYIVYTVDILILSSYLSECYCVNGTYIRVHTSVLLVCTLYIYIHGSYIHSIIRNICVIAQEPNLFQQEGLCAGQLCLLLGSADGDNWQEFPARPHQRSWSHTSFQSL